MFDLKRPCVTVPSARGRAARFQLGRLEEISDCAFQCHKTVD